MQPPPVVHEDFGLSSSTIPLQSAGVVLKPRVTGHAAPLCVVPKTFPAVGGG